ncbi:MAG TPA: pilus assembly protein TadG-related protein [Candidatus Limnocylindria bacterium]|nr:pilus assembly protein TadG-related protein [Candidatus Limnocylindria bacterium]
MRRNVPRGQVLVIVALGLVVLLLFAGLVLDYGVWLVDQRLMRNAADGGAQAGVSELVQKPITAQKQQNAAEHAMGYLNDQLGIGLSAAELPGAATHALLDANGLGSEDATSYTGLDRFVIRTPVTSEVSCTGASWGERALTVRVYHESPRFLTSLLFGGTQSVNVCATAAMESAGYAVAVLKPNDGVQPNGPNLTMVLAGQSSFVRICGGDVGINSMFSGGPLPPPNATVQPAYVKFMRLNSSPSCLGSDEAKMKIYVDDPSPPTWSITAKQVRTEGATDDPVDDIYLAPVHLQNYIQIPTWGQTAYAALNDALVTPVRLQADDPGLGICTPPAGYDPVAPGKYNLIQTGTSVGQYALRWLCPGVYHFVPTNGQQGVQLGSNTTLAGQGVTLVFETGPNHNQDDSAFSIASGSALLLNSAGAGGTQADGPWRTNDPRHDVPLTIWIKPDASCPATPALSCSPSSVFQMGSGSGIDVEGVIFGPTDEMKISGNGAHHGAGEIWAWTISYLGNSTLDQIYEGPDEGYPLIVE